MMTGYFFDASKLCGFTMMPFSFTPSDVVKVKNSFCGRFYSLSLVFSSLLSFTIAMRFPFLSHIEYSKGVFLSLQMFTKYLKPLLKDAELHPSRFVRHSVLPFFAVTYT